MTQHGEVNMNIDGISDVNETERRPEVVVPDQMNCGPEVMPGLCHW